MELTYSFHVLALLLLQLVLYASCAMIDIRGEIRHILRHHNKERRDPRIRAPYMMMLNWDDDLANQAQRWADRCEYRRPNHRDYGFERVGSNLYYEIDDGTTRSSLRNLVKSSLDIWGKGKYNYRSGMPCRGTCDYATMVYYKSDRIGCAVNYCSRIQSGDSVDKYASMLVCLYSPRLNQNKDLAIESWRRPSCSACPRYSTCRDGLCDRPSDDPNPSPVYPTDFAPSSQPQYYQDGFSDNEQFYATDAHNRQRRNNNLDELDWDPHLERWAKHVIRCETNYPGPRHAYTNFARMMQGESPSDIVYQWALEGQDLSLKFEYGCRTPEDRERCNHNTNMLQPQLTSMACAAKACRGGSRQMVCIYDNAVDRAYRRRNRDNRRASNIRRRHGERRRRNRNRRHQGEENQIQ